MLGEVIDYAITMSPFVAGYIGIKYVDRVADKRHMKAIAPVVVDGRTQNEWYDIIKAIGPQATEELMLGPLKSTEKDGEIILDRDTEHAWHPYQVMGHRLWANLEREWYPNEFCTFCDTRNCKGKCAQKRQHDREMEMEKERQEIEAARRKQMSDRKAKIIETKQKMERDFYNTYSKAVDYSRKSGSVQISTVKNMANNNSHYRVTFLGNEYRLSVDDVKKFQHAWGLIPSGYIDSEAVKMLGACLKQGIPIKPVTVNGVKFSARRSGKSGNVKLIAERNGYTATQEILFSSFAELYPRIQLTLRNTLDETEAQAGRAKKSDWPDDLEISLRKARSEMERAKAELKRGMNQLNRVRDAWTEPYDEWMDRQW